MSVPRRASDSARRRRGGVDDEEPAGGDHELVSQRDQGEATGTHTMTREPGKGTA